MHETRCLDDIYAPRMALRQETVSPVVKETKGTSCLMIEIEMFCSEELKERAIGLARYVRLEAVTNTAFP